MFRKNELMELDWTYQKVLSNQAIQLELIKIAYEMLKPGGVMVYSTCSFSYEEDEYVVKSLLDNSDAVLIDMPKSSMLYVNKNNPIGVHLFPSLFEGEGHYICLIKKPGQIIKNDISIKKSNIINKNIQTKLHECDFNHNNVVKFGDYLFSTPFEVRTQNLNILRYGLKIGELIKDEIKYDYHFAHYVHKFNKVINISSEQLSSYYIGPKDALSNVVAYIKGMWEGIVHIFSAKVTLDEMAGPVGISNAVAQTTAISDFIYLLSVISLSLGVTNLLPFPPLDGGKVVLLIIEAIIRKEININVILI